MGLVIRSFVGELRELTLALAALEHFWPADWEVVEPGPATLHNPAF